MVRLEWAVFYVRNGRWCIVDKLSIALLSVALLAIAPARAADVTPPTPRAPPAYDWNGGYIGFHFGYGGGSFGPGTNPVLAQGVFFPPTITGLVGGYQAGWNVQFPDRFVLGVEADLTFISPIDRPATGLAPFHTTFEYLGTARARVGYAFGRLLPYATAGIAWGQTKVEINDNDGNVVSSHSSAHVGWTAGAGVAFPVSGKWTGKIEYNYLDLGAAGFTFPGQAVEPKIHLLKVGLNYRIWDVPPWPSAGGAVAGATSLPESNNFTVHG